MEAKLRKGKETAIREHGISASLWNAELDRPPFIRDSATMTDDHSNTGEEKDNIEKKNMVNSIGVSIKKFPWNKVIKIVVFILFALIVLWCLRSEKKDMFCPEQHCDSKLCGDGKGKWYQGGMPKTEDTTSDTLDKIVYLSEIESRTVKWRRSLILSLVVMGIIYAIGSKVPSMKDFFLTLIPVFVVVYGSFSYYQYHYYKFPQEFIKQNVDKLRKKIGTEIKDYSKEPTRFPIPPVEKKNS